VPAALREIIAVAVRIWAVVAEVDIDQYEIGIIKRMTELENGLIIPDAGRWDAEIQEVHIHPVAGSMQIGFEARHDAVRVRRRPVGKRIAQCHNAEASRRLGDSELLIIQPQGIGPIIQEVAVRSDVSTLRGEVLVQAPEHVRRLAHPGRGQVSHFNAKHGGQAHDKLANQDGEQKSQAQEQRRSPIHASLLGAGTLVVVVPGIPR
jgi:hypothetical protein